MTWSPGQETAIHDHDDMWCVECVYSGTIEITPYDVSACKRGSNLFQLTPAAQSFGVVGQAGQLIPPKDVHKISNASCEHTACTIHVYGGHMEKCGVFTPLFEKKETDLYRKEKKTLYFTRCPNWCENCG